MNLANVKLLAELETLLERRPRKIPIDFEFQLIRKLPCDDFAKVFESRHAEDRSNFVAALEFENSGLKPIAAVPA